jgi:hypothetical protein
LNDEEQRLILRVKRTDGKSAKDEIGWLWRETEG